MAHQRQVFELKRRIAAVRLIENTARDERKRLQRQLKALLKKYLTCPWRKP